MNPSWQDAADVGLMMLPPQAAAAAVERCADDLAALADLVVTQKVAGAARVRLQEVPRSTASEKFLGLVDGLREPADRRMATIPALLEAVAAAADASGITWSPMKGCSIRQSYPDPRLRDVGDIDIWVPSAEDAWTLSETLLPMGYVYAPWELPWFKKSASGELYGQVRVVRLERDRAAVDFHIGPYSVRHCGTMPLGRHRGGRLLVEDDIAAIFGNAAGDCMLDLKSVNDLHVLVPLVTNVGRIHALLDHGGLLPFLRGALDRIRRLTGLPAGLTESLERLEPAPGPQEDVQVTPEGGDRLRIAQTVTHSVDIALRDHPHQVRAIVASAADAYSYDHPLTAVPRPAFRLGPLVSWECVRLVPVDGTVHQLPAGAGTADVEHPIRLLSLKEGDLVAVGDRVFIPTVDFRVPQDLVAALRDAGLSVSVPA
ncbi:nucleotidyltransferase family protein [Streptomyces sp. NBC_00536]|uniref:nucleotidyltransferase family protein n=1 Tax=Streptomyces sp. NBC_00536 TaxID=2975769 RepID=UPI002E812C98|nr:nucleotidyltransferase family protein [Streptomyces sp. NBC_00536]WUC83277.1 nucleotidyltransferase family protein [Streptomyces sp. NBC_00536]